MRQLHPRRLMICLGAGLVWACLTQISLGQGKPVKVKFDTVDQVKLQGLFYPSDKKADAACVLLLHEIGGKSNQKGWNELAVKLQKQGYAVLSFDFRGHGDSTSVDPEEFWNARLYPNAHLKHKKDQDTINFRSFPKAYYPYLVNDIAAAKVFLDARNDAGECNSKALILIGAKEGATIGALWLKMERYRYRILERFGQRILDYDKKPESSDVIAAVWLCISPKLGKPYSARELFPPSEKKVPMAFLYGEKDTASGNFSKAAVKAIINGRKNVKGIAAFRISKSAALSGAKLLGNDLKTEDIIVNDFLAPVTDPGLESHETREFKKQEYVYLSLTPPKAPFIVPATNIVKVKGKNSLLFIQPK